jgi:hypothetical protein
MITDSENSIEQLLKRLKVVGVKNISVSSLIMRPSIMNQFIEELPFGLVSAAVRIRTFHGSSVIHG